MSQPTHVVIMAGGKGTRLQALDRPKVLFPIAGKPMLEYVIRTIETAGFEKPILVVGYLADQVKATFGSGYRYALQPQMLGTGNAVMATKDLLQGQPGYTLILNGDHPFIHAQSLHRLLDAVQHQNATLAILTGELHDSEYDASGRVVLGRTGVVKKIVEAKDATNSERQLRLMNLGVYAVDNTWLWQALPQIKPSPKTGEYYITELVALATIDNKTVLSVTMDDEEEAIGINTPEHLKHAEQQLEKQAYALA